MRADKNKLLLAMARACMNTRDVVRESGMPEMTVKNVIAGKGVKPATLGRVAKALNVDPAEIVEKGEKVS